MPSSSLLPAWTRSAGLSLTVHVGVIGALLWGTPAGSVRGTTRAAPEASARFVPRAAPASPAAREPEPLPELEREPRLEPTIVRAVPVLPEALELPPVSRPLERIEFLPRAFEGVRPDAFGPRDLERVAPAERAPDESAVARALAPSPAPPPAERVAPERELAGDPAGEVVLPVPRADACPQPDYPAAALRRRLQGTVLCRLTIDAGGRVLAVVVERSSGEGLLDRTAREALLAWRFEPGSRAGRPCSMDVWKAVEFRLPR